MFSLNSLTGEILHSDSELFIILTFYDDQREWEVESLMHELTIFIKFKFSISVFCVRFIAMSRYLSDVN